MSTIYYLKCFNLRSLLFQNGRQDNFYEAIPFELLYRRAKDQPPRISSKTCIVNHVYINTVLTSAIQA